MRARERPIGRTRRASLRRQCTLAHPLLPRHTATAPARRRHRLALPPAQSLALVDKVRRVTAETDQKLLALDSEYQANKDVVIGMLLQVVLSIDNPFHKK